MIQGLGERLQKQRLLMNISQKEAASKIGVSPAIISNYENSERTPSLENLIALASLYHCSTDSLLGIEKSTSVSIDTSMLDDHQAQLLQSFLNGLR